MEWIYGTKMQPEVRAHMGQIEAWLRYWDHHKGTRAEEIAKACDSAVERVGQAQHKSGKDTHEVKSSMSACIHSTRKTGFEPAGPGTRIAIWAAADMDENVDKSC